MLCAVAAPAPAAQPATLVRTAQLMQQLKAGGFVLVVVHGTTERNDPQALSDTGRLNASGLGRVLAYETVPISTVYASPVRSSTETAERIAEHSADRTVDRAKGDARWRVLRLTDLAPAPKARPQALRALASSPPAGIGNTLVVTQRANLVAAFGARFADAGPGEVAVFKPATGAAGYTLVARLPLRELAAYHSRLRKQIE